MNTNELLNFNLSDAIKFHDRLNPSLWDENEKLKPEVREKLLEIARDFQEFLGVNDLEVEDITISGSNAAYSYTPHSDIDLHLVVNSPKLCDEVYQELFNAKKYQYNDQHNIRVRNSDVELYVQPADEPHVSLGIYSVLNNKWVQIPRRKRADVNHSEVKLKYEDLKTRIKNAVASKDLTRIDAVVKKIKEMRQAGLDAHGEFGPENLAFKMLRTQGVIKKLYDARNKIKDQLLSLKERGRQKQQVRYGFTSEASTPDGVAPTTCMFLNEQDAEGTLKSFIKSTAKMLGIKRMPKVVLHRDDNWSTDSHSFGRFDPETHTLHVSLDDRHILDILRTTAHELAHCRQHEVSPLPANAGKTGSSWENEAHAIAGIIMRNFADSHPEYFESEAISEASGYIPTKAQANDPRFSMALTKDIRPGQTGREANKMSLQTDAQGKPALLIRNLKNALREFKETGKLDVKTFTPKELARKHGVTEKQILAQLKKGIAVEREHTSDPATAREIALDHLNELPDYYDRLTKAERLDEVKMSPSALRDFASSPEARGIQAGFEAEMIFPGLGDTDGGDSEPDYDYDERAYSINDIINFFEYDDYGYGLSDREANRLREDLDEQWMEYFDDAMYSEWDSVRFTQVRDYIERNDWDQEEQIENYLRDELGLSEEQIAEVTDAANQATSTRDQPEEYRKAEEAVAELLDSITEQTIDEEDRTYERALDEFRDDFSGVSEEDWLRENYRYMSDVAEAFNITWPYISYTGGDGEYNRDAAERLAADLTDSIGVNTKVSSGYHSAKRDATSWIFEPDSSLEPNDSDDMPVEIITPPMPLQECLASMDAFFKWAERHGAYTNDSTGFHMGVSLPITGGKTDFIKLALFLGDEHVLDAFGRSSNTYTEAAMKKIRNKVKQTHNSAQVADAMTLMRSGLTELATRALKVVGSDGFGKYTSINPKGNYIEFRSAGGEDYFEDINKIQNTLLRYARAMTIAANPSAERKEYNKKLYKLIAPQGGNPALDLFAKYATGEISPEELKTRWAEQTLAKDAPETQEKSTWVVYDTQTKQYVPNMKYSGYTESEAFALAKQAMSPGSSMLGFRQMFKDRYELRNVSKSTGKWAIIDRDSGETLEVVDSPNRGDAADLAMQKYSGQGIDYYIEPVQSDEPKPKLSRRAELAKRIKEPKDKKMWQMVSDTTGERSEPFTADSPERAKQVAMNIARATQYSGGYTVEPAQSTTQNQQPVVGATMADQEQMVQAAHAANAASQTPAGADVRWTVINNTTGDSSVITAPSRFRANAMVMDLARRMGVDGDNFTIEPLNSAPLQQPQTTPQTPAPAQSTVRQPNQAVTDAGIPMWEIYVRETGQAVNRFPDHNQSTAWSTAQQWLRDAHAPESTWSDYSVRPLMQEPPAR